MVKILLYSVPTNGEARVMASKLEKILNTSIGHRSLDLMVALPQEVCEVVIIALDDGRGKMFSMRNYLDSLAQCCVKKSILVILYTGHDVGYIRIAQHAERNHHYDECCVVDNPDDDARYIAKLIKERIENSDLIKRKAIEV